MSINIDGALILSGLVLIISGYVWLHRSNEESDNEEDMIRDVHGTYYSRDRCYWQGIIFVIAGVILMLTGIIALII